MNPSHKNNAMLGFEQKLWAAATVRQIAAEGFILSPHRYVGKKAVDADAETPLEQIKALSMQLQQEYQNRHRLEQRVMEGLKRFLHAG